MSEPAEDFPEPVLPPLGERPLASLVIIAYNQEDYIRETIAGALAQTYEPLEIILSDDNSPDGTFRVMEEMAAAYEGPHRIILNRNDPNLGIVRNAERGIELSSGELIIENSGDDVSVPHRVARLVEFWLSTGRKAKAIHSARRRMDMEGNLHEVIDDMRVLADMTPLEVIRDHGTLVGATLAYTRDIFDVFGPISPVATFHDFPIAFRAVLIGELRYIPEPLIHYRQGGVSSRPDTDFGYNHLYGFRIKSYRWHMSFWHRYLADMEIVKPPDYELCKRICGRKIAAVRFSIGLAEASYPKRLLTLPKSVALSLFQRDGRYVKEHFRYLLGPIYMRRLDRKAKRYWEGQEAYGQPYDYQGSSTSNY